MPRLPWIAFAASTAILAVCASPLVAPRSAAAHPLGNFSINHYTRIDVSEAGIELDRVLEMAEIPALQERQQVDTNDDDEIDAAESETYAAAQTAELAGRMSLWVNNQRVSLVEPRYELTFPEGQGGLPLLRLRATYRADLPQGWSDSSPRVEFIDSNYVDRVGWREIVVRGGPGVELVDSTVPAADISAELTAFPEDQLKSPIDYRTAIFGVRPGVGAPFPAEEPQTAAAGATDEDNAVRGNPDGTLSRFSDLIAKDDLSAGVIIVALLGAMVFGALHALSPGHGKTVVAAYLIGSRGTAKHALLLGLVVTATHTSTVYLVGFVALYLSQYILPEDLYPWLGIASGTLILAMGLTLFTGRLRASGLLGDTTTWLRARVSPRGRPPLALAGQAGNVGLSMPGSGTSDARAHEHTHTSGADHDHRRDAVPEHHVHVDDDEPRPHSQGFGPAHSHRIPGQDGEPVTIRSLVGLGMFGGMIPCPSAIVVMLSAIALHRVAFGLVLIVAFSLGLACVLVAIGFALVYARTIGDRVPLLQSISGRVERGGFTSVLARAFPVAAAAAVVVAGLIVTLRALAQQGVL